MPRFATRCDSRSEPASSEPGAPLGGTVDPDAGLPVLFGQRGERSYRGFLDSTTVAALARSRESGAALDAVAPIASRHAGSGAGRRGGLLFFLGLATLAYLANRGA